MSAWPFQTIFEKVLNVEDMDISLVILACLAEWGLSLTSWPEVSLVQLIVCTLEINKISLK